VTVDDAAQLIGGARIGGGAMTWADLGCGDGTFTLALAAILPRGSIIHAMDRDISEPPISAIGAASDP
jgi:ubiquinone/menaquinone biosynthesis C-methylase UbiE